MPYDHHKKAGNQGDCVKHPALIAALDAVLQMNKTEVFHYLDVFAGHAWHPLLDEKEYEWRNGIGKLASAKLPDDAPDSVKCWWATWHEAPEWPTTTPPGYPGSSWIAAHRCRKAKRPVKLELYDHSEEARRDLERAFPGSHAIQENSQDICLIGKSLIPSPVKRDHIKQADFVFIDPPGWQSTDHPEYPKWEDFLDQVLEPRAQPPTLMWMPTAGNNGAFNGQPSEKIRAVASIGYFWSAVRWQTAGAGTACVLVYNFALTEIRAAVDCIAKIADWTVKHSDGASASK